MRISDWSSDVCSSDLPYPVFLITSDEGGLTLSAAHKRKAQNEAGRVVVEGVVAAAGLHLDGADAMQTAFLASLALAAQPRRWEERRVGKECVRPCRSLWSPLP